MAKLFTPKVLLRGFEIFAVASLLGFALTLLYGNNLNAFLGGIGRLQWGWVVLGVGLASMDWIGGGLRLWVVARQLMPNPSLKGLILAGGMSAWAAYITPMQSGSAPMMMYTMKRYGIPLPVAATSALMGFVGTVAFFASGSLSHRFAQNGLPPSSPAPAALSASAATYWASPSTTSSSAVSASSPGSASCWSR